MFPKLAIRVLTSVVLAGSALSYEASAQTKYHFTPVIRFEHPAAVPATLSTISSASFNNAGQVAFTADNGVFLKSGDDLDIVAALRAPAPGGARFISATSPALNSNGQMVFRGSASLPTGTGLFLYQNGSLTKIVSAGDPAPGGGILNPTSPSLSSNGKVSFLSGNAIFLLSNGVITRLVSSGDLAPGGGTFTTLTSPLVNSAGQVVFTASLSGGASGIFLASEGALLSVARSGEIISGTARFAFFTTAASINDAGDVAFTAVPNGPASLYGIYVYSGGTRTLRVSLGQPVPGGGSLISADFPSINASGNIAFRAGVSGVNGTSVLVFTAGNLVQVARPGQGTPEGDILANAFNPILNASGQVLFTAQTNIHGNTLYSFSNGQITRVAGQGDTIQRNPRFFALSSFGLGDEDQVLFLGATFPGGTGLFTKTPDQDAARVAGTGDPVPGGGIVFNILNNFSMNAAGIAAMNLQTIPAGSEIVVGTAGNLTKIARGSQVGGDPAPGGGTFFNFNSPSINNVGQVVFPGSVIGGTSGMFLFSNSVLTQLIKSTDPLPGGGSIGTMSSPSLNDAGQIAMFVQPFPRPNGIYLWSQGTLTAIARNGDPAPGGSTFVLPFPNPNFGPVIDNQGDVAFAATLASGGSAVFLYSQGTLKRVAGTGDSTPDGSMFLSADSPSLNASGQLVFAAGLASQNAMGIFLYSNGTLLKVAENGDRIPGNDTLVFASSPKINNAEEVVFTGASASRNVEIFIARPEGIDDPEDELGTTDAVAQYQFFSDGILRNEELIQEVNTPPEDLETDQQSADAPAPDTPPTP